MLIAIQLHKPYKVAKLSIRLAKICNFSRIERKAENLKHSKRQKLTFRDKRKWSL